MKLKAKLKKQVHRQHIICTRNEKEEENSLPYLPEDVVYEILARIPAEILHEKFRHICKSWHNLISSKGFIASQNALQSKHQCLIQHTGKNLCSRTTLLDLHNIELNFKATNFPMRRMGKIMSSCNGLILVTDPKDDKQLHILNIVTKCRVTLPSCGSHLFHTNCGLTLTFNPSTKEYKVVHIYSDGYGFEIYTLGCPDAKWKRLPGPFEGKVYERPYKFTDFHWSAPVTINGHILHWYVESNEYVISMDIGDDKSSRTPLPTCDWTINKDNYTLLELEGYLSFVYQVSGTQIDIWVLNDFRKQVWFKKHSIIAELTRYANLEDSSVPSKYDGLLPNLAKLIPVGTVSNGEVILFRQKESRSATDDRLYLYDPKKRKLKKFKMTVKGNKKFISHKSSLISWKTEEELLPKRTEEQIKPGEIT